MASDRRSLGRWHAEFEAAEGSRGPVRFYQWRLTPGELCRDLELNGFSCSTLRLLES
jgi:hypothetical protein